MGNWCYPLFRSFPLPGGADAPPQTEIPAT